MINTNNASTPPDSNATSPTKISGIYKIINKINGKYYVGSSNDISSRFGRWYEHKQTLKNDNHRNGHLQSSYNKYGEKNFEYIIMEKCPSDVLLITEQKYLNIAKKEKKRVYNINFVADRLEMTKEISKKISLSKIGKQMGKDNPNYKSVPDDIFNETKEFWIQYGLTKTKIFLKNKGYKSGVCNRLIKEFNSDLVARNLRKKNFHKEHQRFSKNLKIKSGKEHYLYKLGAKSHPNYDNTIYKFKNIKTQEGFEGTRYEFRKKYNLSKSADNIINKKSRCYKGWTLIFKTI